MPLADRTYMRGGDSGRAWSPTIILLVINALVFFLGWARGPAGNQALIYYGGLSLEGLGRGFVWQFISYQFLHGGLPHLVLNSFVLYMFGRAIEEMLGTRSFLKLYLWSGVVGGAFQILLALVLPGLGGASVPTVGASASICGLVAAAAMLAPDSTIYAFMVLPIRARYFLIFAIAVSVICLILAPGSQIAHAAHLGGILMGIAYVRWFHGLSWRFPLLGRFRFPRRAHPVVKVRFPKAVSGAAGPGPRAKRIDEAGPTDFISKEVDPILEKISAQGIHSLTDRERRILEAARSKMEKR